LPMITVYYTNDIVAPLQLKAILVITHHENVKDYLLFETNDSQQC